MERHDGRVPSERCSCNWLQEVGIGIWVGAIPATCGGGPGSRANIFVTGTTDILSFVLFLGLAALVIERIV